MKKCKGLSKSISTICRIIIIKTLLISAIFLTLNSISYAQCEFDSPGVVLNTTTFDGTNCSVNINLSFDMESNNGNKFIFVYLWTLSDYGNVSHSYSKGPAASELGNVLATMVIDNSGPSPVLIGVYGPDPSNITPLTTGLSISTGPGLNTGFVRYYIDNIALSIPGSCNNIPSFKGDAWSSNANSAKSVVHCSTVIELIKNNISIDGQINCNSAGLNTYNMTVSTTENDFPMNYRVFLDDGDGILEAGTEDVEVGSGSATISSTSSYSANNVNYSYKPSEVSRSLWLIADGEGVPYYAVKEIKSNCSLPVKMTYFRSVALERSINLVWATTEESRSAYYDIERSNDGKEFSRIGRLNAQGMSTSNTVYTFSDHQPMKGVNYYRLKQVDLDGTYAKSKIVSAMFDENSSLFELLGNPSDGGSIHFLMRNLSKGDLKLFDISGKPIPYSITNSGNEFYLKPRHKLGQGLYILRVTDKGSSIARKVLVN